LMTRVENRIADAASSSAHTRQTPTSRFSFCRMPREVSRVTAMLQEGARYSTA
jgi:hypothetical protein